MKMVPIDAEGSIYISIPWDHIFYHVIPNANVKETISFSCERYHGVREAMECETHGGFSLNPPPLSAEIKDLLLF